MKFELKTFNRNVPDEDLLSDLQKVAKELGKENITYKEYDGTGKYSSTTIRDRFGSWNKALEESVLVVKEQKNISVEEFIRDLKKVAEELEKDAITSREY